MSFERRKYQRALMAGNLAVNAFLLRKKLAAHSSQLAANSFIGQFVLFFGLHGIW
jgi:hypothetical protein